MTLFGQVASSMVKSTLFSILAVLLMVSHAAAHAIDGRWRIRADKLEVRAFFDDDSPAEDAKVRVLDLEAKQVQEGKTDADGLCVLPLPPAGEYHIVIDAGAGHRKTIEIRVPAAGYPAGSSADDYFGPDQPTSQRWLKAGIGIGVIGVLALAAWVALRRSGKSSPVSDIPPARSG